MSLFVENHKESTKKKKKTFPELSSASSQYKRSTHESLLYLLTMYLLTVYTNHEHVETEI